MKKTNVFLAVFVLFCMGMVNVAEACTSFLVTKGASKDGSVFNTYAADSHVLYGALYYNRAAQFPEGSMLKIIDWDSGKTLGEIKQVAKTYNTVGNMNEHQVAITETTFGGKEELQDTTGIMDYGSLIYITLQRAKSAREAIKVMTDLVAEYGYYSGGESFSISDANEAWILEMIGKGAPVKDSKGKIVKGWTKGAVWVAVRIPDGYVSGHANQARIGKFPLEQKKSFKSISSKNMANLFKPEVEYVYAHDIFEFAKIKGYFTGKPEDFDFTATFAPITFSATRFCEARVWSGFRKITTGMDQYTNYVLGKDLKAERLPLWVKPTAKLGLADVIGLMRDHYENTPIDMTKDVGAGPFECPYRWRPMTWSLNGKNYIHERAISTQQTGFSLVAQSRSQYPDPIGGILWFGVDDTYSTVYTPMYCGINSVPHCFDENNGSMCEYSETAAYWIFNQVSMLAYSRYNEMINDVQKVQSSLEKGFESKTAEMDKKAFDKWSNGQGEQEVRNMLTSFSHEQADLTCKSWKKLGQYLLVKYMDGNVKKEENGKFKENPYRKGANVAPSNTRYPDWFYQMIIDQKGNLIEDLGTGH